MTREERLAEVERLSLAIQDESTALANYAMQMRTKAKGDVLFVMVCGSQGMECLITHLANLQQDLAGLSGEPISD